jgi:hypothetical protein
MPGYGKTEAICDFFDAVISVGYNYGRFHIGSMYLIEEEYL